MKNQPLGVAFLGVLTFVDSLVSICAASLMQLTTLAPLVSLPSLGFHNWLAVVSLLRMLERVHVNNDR